MKRAVNILRHEMTKISYTTCKWIKGKIPTCTNPDSPYNGKQVSYSICRSSETIGGIVIERECAWDYYVQYKPEPEEKKVKNETMQTSNKSRKSV